MTEGKALFLYCRYFAGRRAMGEKLIQPLGTFFVGMNLRVIFPIQRIAENIADFLLGGGGRMFDRRTLGAVLIGCLSANFPNFVFFKPMVHSSIK